VLGAAFPAVAFLAWFTELRWPLHRMAHVPD
jgi:hypothetical protein